MENANVGLFVDGNLFDCPYPEFPVSDSPGANPRASLAVERSANPSGETRLSLLCQSDCENDTQDERNSADHIHYDFRWEVSQRENIRARLICSGSASGVVLAPSDYWRVSFKKQLDDLFKDKDKFPGNSYKCEANIVVSFERTRQRGLAERFESTTIDCGYFAVGIHCQWTQNGPFLPFLRYYRLLF